MDPRVARNLLMLFGIAVSPTASLAVDLNGKWLFGGIQIVTITQTGNSLAIPAGLPLTGTLGPTAALPNAFSSPLRGRDPALPARMTKAVEDGDLRLSLVVLFELKYGAEKALLSGERRPAERVARLQRTVPVELLPEAAATHYGRLRSHLEKDGRLIGAMDMILAARAPAMNAVVITGNTGEFERAPDLRIENWRADGR